MNTPEELRRYKIKQLERLRASTFAFADYTPPSTEWDHDHCEACWAKFALSDRPGILHRGYLTTIVRDSELGNEPEAIHHAWKPGSKVVAKPDAKVWICPKCFEEFRVTLGWKLESKNET